MSYIAHLRLCLVQVGDITDKINDVSDALWRGIPFLVVVPHYRSSVPAVCCSIFVNTATQCHPLAWSRGDEIGSISPLVQQSDQTKQIE
jgi:hypothetical protein